MAQTIQSTQGNIKNSLDAGDLAAARESAEQKAQALANEAKNPFAAADAEVDDYQFVVAINDQKIKKDVWVSTGCPVPSISNEDLGEAISTRDFKIYDEDGNLNQIPVSLLEHCYGEDYTYSTNYYVYPTPVVYSDETQLSNLVASDCEPNQLYDSYKGDSLNPLDHPCYWGKLEPGESVRIPLNKHGWSLADVSNLKLRLRTPCVSGEEWCADSERVTYENEINWDSINIEGIDDSELITTWVVEVNGGQLNYGSSKGGEEFLDSTCSTRTSTCREEGTHSEITTYRMFDSSYKLGNSSSYFDFDWLLSTDIFGKSLAVINLSTNRSPQFDSDFNDRTDNNLISYLINRFVDISPRVVFQLDNITRNDSDGKSLEFQIISNRKLPKK